MASGCGRAAGRSCSLTAASQHHFLRSPLLSLSRPFLVQGAHRLIGVGVLGKEELWLL